MNAAVTIQEVKHRCYAMRNGAVADTMRRLGAPYRVIFGVNLPQLKEIASDIQPDAALAAQLWATDSTRECVLIAPMIMPHDAFPIETARQWIATAPSTEAIDVLCLKLLGKMPYKAELADELLLSDSELTRYASMRLRNYI